MTGFQIPELLVKRNGLSFLRANYSNFFQMLLISFVAIAKDGKDYEDEG